MDKPSTSGLPRKPSTGCRVRLILAKPKLEGTAIPTSQPRVLPNVGTSQPPETSGCNLYSEIIKEAMAKLNRDGTNAGKTNSSESLSKVATQSDTHTNPTTSSSLRFSTDDEEKVEEGHGKKRTGQTFEEIASEVIREMHEIEEKEKRKSKGTQGAGEPLQIPTEAASREPR